MQLKTTLKATLWYFGVFLKKFHPELFFGWAFLVDFHKIRDGY